MSEKMYCCRRCGAKSTRTDGGIHNCRGGEHHDWLDVSDVADALRAPDARPYVGANDGGTAFVRCVHGAYNFDGSCATCQMPNARPASADDQLDVTYAEGFAAGRRAAKISGAGSTLPGAPITGGGDAKGDGRDWSGQTSQTSREGGPSLETIAAMTPEQRAAFVSCAPAMPAGTVAFTTTVPRSASAQPADLDALPDVVSFRKLAMAYLGGQGVFSPKRCEPLVKLLKEVYDAGRAERQRRASRPNTTEDGYVLIEFHERVVDAAKRASFSNGHAAGFEEGQQATGSASAEEIALLRALAEQARRYHEDCGHDSPSAAAQCDPICAAWKAWATRCASPPQEANDDAGDELSDRTRAVDRAAGADVPAGSGGARGLAFHGVASPVTDSSGADYEVADRFCAARPGPCENYTSDVAILLAGVRRETIEACAHLFAPIASYDGAAVVARILASKEKS